MLVNKGKIILFNLILQQSEYQHVIKAG